jgi:DNA-binding IclR family transcriptional regulator
MSQDSPSARKAPASAPRRETIGAVDHAINLLRCLSETGAPIGVNDIARRIGIHKSSVSRLAATLEKARLVQRDPVTGRLSLGIGLLALAAPVIAGFDVRKVVQPSLVNLAAQTGETVSFSIWDGAEAVSIEQVPGSSSVRTFSRPGHRNPGHATASGKVLLAHMGEAAIEAYCGKPLHRFTASTLTDPSVLKAELTRCRMQLYAVNTGEFESDVGAVSAIVLDGQSQVLGAVSATVPMYRFDEARRLELAEAVRRCATELSEGLGYSGTPGSEA